MQPMGVKEARSCQEPTSFSYHFFGVCYRFIGDVVQTFKAPKTISSTQIDANPIKTDSGPQNCVKFEELAAEALTTVFGMDAEGRIKKERARRVVEDLGLIGTEQEDNGFELLGSSEDELRVEEIVDGLDDEDAIRRAELLRRAFTVFDEDGDGYIEAMEVKRVLECLGLAKGWGVEEFEKMVQVADLNFDGKVDFGEFELMMGVKM